MQAVSALVGGDQIKVPPQQLIHMQNSKNDPANMTSRENGMGNSVSNLELAFKIKKQSTQHDIMDKDSSEDKAGAEPTAVAA